MEYRYIPFWKEAPFLRIILPLAAGILLQYYLHITPVAYWILLAFSITGMTIFAVLKSVVQFTNYWVTGILINLLFLSLGSITAFYKDLRNDPGWFMKEESRPGIIATIKRPLSEGPNSFRTIASIDYILNSHEWKRSRGKLILYLQKDSSCSKLRYNIRIVFNKRVMEIQNTGNPAAFDFKRYCAFQNIFHQVYLRPGEYAILDENPKTDIKTGLFRAREWVVDLLRRYIPGKKEAGLAEALLIGYKEDLDKELVQSYSRTGVIHVIAISGLHVGLIYGLLSGIFTHLPAKKPLRILKAVSIITGLWAFGFLAGGGASVLRSVLMFSFLVWGQNMGRKAIIINSLFASAFCLLFYDPFLLWDVGFQLSYLAVLSILLFTKPLYNCVYVRNKGLDLVWKSCTICMAAQWLTTPASIYHFHQFPNYFLVTNLVAVPLSGIIIIAEIVLCGGSFLSFLPTVLGIIIYWLVGAMNGFIGHMEAMPYAATERLTLSFGELIIVYIALCSMARWLLFKNKSGLLFALSAVTVLYCSQCASIVKALNQKKLIIYNVPHHRAIDLVKGRQYVFSGDAGIMAKPGLRNFHIDGARTLYRLQSSNTSLARASGRNCLFFENKRIFIVDKPIIRDAGVRSLKVDMIIISGDPNIRIPELLEAVDCSLFIFDSSNSLRKVRQWQADCLAYGVNAYSVTEKGAFILNLN